jgi:Tol biopolymer transport system component
VFVTHLERTESEQLNLPPAFLLSVSSKDELLVLLTPERSAYSSIGTLARVPAVGGTPRPLIDDARYADWAPDGEHVAAIRSGPGRLEFLPIGRSIAGNWAMARVSPRDDRIALLSGTSGVEIQDGDGHRLAADGILSPFGIAWSPDGRELWYTGSESGAAHDRALYALSLDGTRRLIARAPGAMTIYDVSQDGKSALIATGAGWTGISAARVGQDQETPLDLRGRSEVVGLSADGRWLLANERREVGAGVWRRSTDGTQTTHLSDDVAIGLSADGAWALVRPPGSRSRLTLVPAGAGSPRALPLDPTLEISPVWTAQWSRDGRRLFVALRPVGGDDRAARVYVRDGDGPWQAVTPEGVAGAFAVSPNGETIAVRDVSGSVALFPTGGGAPRRLEGERGSPIHWSADGHQLFLLGPEQFPARVYRRDLATGRVEHWRDIAPADPTGVMGIGRVFIAVDDRTYVYQYIRGLNDLYLAQGLR